MINEIERTDSWWGPDYFWRVQLGEASWDEMAVRDYFERRRERPSEAVLARAIQAKEGLGYQGSAALAACPVHGAPIGQPCGHLPGSDFTCGQRAIAAALVVSEVGQWRPLFQEETNAGL